MDDSLFDRCGWDPSRIFTAMNGGPPGPGGIMRLNPRLIAAESGAEATADPPPQGEGDHPKGGGGAPTPHATPEPPADPASDSASAAPAPPGSNPAVRAWLDEHWDIVEAMALAGEAPQRPAPPEPQPEPEPEPESEPEPEPQPEPAPEPAYPLSPVELLPVHVRKGDRWNKPKMAEFLRQLAATHSVSAAARAVGMRRQSAYKLRARLKGQPFDIAWEAAFRHGYDNLAHAALELALEGEEVPHYYQGELKGTHRKRNPHLLLGLLRMHNDAGAPQLGRYGAAAEFWSEKWEQMVHRIETGSVTWDDETGALGDAGLARLDLPDETQEVDRLIARNLPDEPKRRFRK